VLYDRVPVEQSEDCPLVAERLGDCRGAEQAESRRSEVERLLVRHAGSEQEQLRRLQIVWVPLVQSEGEQVQLRRPLIGWVLVDQSEVASVRSP